MVARETGQLYPEVAPLVLPYSSVGVLVVVCTQVALVAIWHLLKMVGSGAIFTGASLRGVDVITVCATVAAALTAGLAAHLLLVARLSGPTVLLLLGASAALLAVALLMVVMRGLLGAAIGQHAELQEVV